MSNQNISLYFMPTVLYSLLFKKEKKKIQQFPYYPFYVSIHEGSDGALSDIR